MSHVSEYTSEWPITPYMVTKISYHSPQYKTWLNKDFQRAQPSTAEQQPTAISSYIKNNNLLTQYKLSALPTAINPVYSFNIFYQHQTQTIDASWTLVSFQYLAQYLLQAPIYCWTVPKPLGVVTTSLMKKRFKRDPNLNQTHQADLSPPRRACICKQ